MKIALYSDLHLEFCPGWKLPHNLDADILASPTILSALENLTNAEVFWRYRRKL